MADNSNSQFRKPNLFTGQPASLSSSAKSRLMKPPAGRDLDIPAQAGCSTLGAGGYRNKVVLKPGHSALDWSELCNTKGKKGELVTGIDKLLNDPDFHRLNNPQTLLALQHNVPPFKLYPPARINKAQLAQHKAPEDCWCVINQKVYCISSYLDFHPGGVDILMKGAAGKDCTSMFNKYHRWVNYEKVLETSLVGTYVA